MFKKKATSNQIDQGEQANTREKIEITLHKLQALKDKISELRCQCEELRELGLESKVSLCSECGNAIEPDQEVVVKDSTGMERRYYHMKCFQTLLK